MSVNRALAHWSPFLPRPLWSSEALGPNFLGHRHLPLLWWETDS